MDGLPPSSSLAPPHGQSTIVPTIPGMTSASTWNLLRTMNLLSAMTLGSIQTSPMAPLHQSGKDAGQRMSALSRVETEKKFMRRAHSLTQHSKAF